jgi:hypothetical protein
VLRRRATRRCSTQSSFDVARGRDASVVGELGATVIVAAIWQRDLRRGRDSAPLSTNSPRRPATVRALDSAGPIQTGALLRGRRVSGDGWNVECAFPDPPSARRASSARSGRFQASRRVRPSRIPAPEGRLPRQGRALIQAATQSKSTGRAFVVHAHEVRSRSGLLRKSRRLLLHLVGAPSASGDLQSSVTTISGPVASADSATYGNPPSRNAAVTVPDSRTVRRAICTPRSPFSSIATAFVPSFDPLSLVIVQRLAGGRARHVRQRSPRIRRKIDHDRS